ncbi:hypothetical protein LSCM1_04740 [Leishmania martiniquensis]|uniref:Transmembrane protein n=1 Tax=Leishmania martiniquensis TaxID=1580590 RepID=A0A836GQJ8_9TRYP|nr:hypothetical protein LSCM1_04740 [Leishmania martiniquensis]
MEDRGRRDEPQRSANAMEQPVSVKVSPPTLLDIKAEVLRPNPSLFVTSFSTLLTAILLGLCFVIVSIPPFYIANARGRQIYVGMMVPLLTVIGTVLSHYSIQHPQRRFNAALAQIVKEMEHHATYLSTAVGNVEMELETRGASLRMATTAESARLCSYLATPSEPALQRLSSSVAPGGAAAAMPTTIPDVGGSGFLRGIDRLEEERDMIISTVHVGKEWRWLIGLLEKLNLRSLSGPTNPVIHHQRIAVRALMISVARVERMILSLYFSSFALHSVNTLSPVSLGELPASLSIAANSPVSGNAAGVGWGHAQARTTPPALQPPAPDMPSMRLPSLQPPGGEVGDSLTESVFTIPKETPNQSGDGAEMGAAGEETASQLTSLDTKGFNLGGVKLVQFPPLLSGNRAGREPRRTHANARAEPPAAAAVAAASPSIARALHMDTDAQWPVEKEKAEERARQLGQVSPSEHSMRSFEGTSRGADGDGQGEPSGEFTPLAVSVGGYASAGNPSYTHTATLCIQSRTIAVVGNGEEEEVVFSPRSGVSTQQPVPSVAGGRDNGDSVTRSRISTPPADGNGTRASPMSSSLSRTPAPGATHRRQPGSAVVASPSLTLQRGSRFKGDEKDVFATVLIHVLKGKSTRYSRRYGAVAHTSYDASADCHYFVNGSDTSLMRLCSFSPFTIFYIPNQGDQREGLTILEQKLLQFVYCRPEESDEGDSVCHPWTTDLSSLAVRGTGRGSEDDAAASAPATEIQAGSLAATFPCETPSSPNCIPHRTPVSPFAEHRVSSFIVAMQLLQDRPMRLAFLPVAIEPAQPKGTSQVLNGVAPQSSTTPRRANVACSREGMHRDRDGSVYNPQEGTTHSTLEEALQAPSSTMVPVLECVIDDVLCILTEIEITVDSSFQRPSKLLLIGVSLEDVSEEGTEHGELDVNEDKGLSRGSQSTSTGSLSLDFASGTVQPTDGHDLPRLRATKDAEVTLESPHKAAATTAGQAKLNDVTSKAGPSLPRHENGSRCTLGQEFREVIYLE